MEKEVNANTTAKPSDRAGISPPKMDVAATLANTIYRINTNLVWHVECMMCDTAVDIDAEAIISTDQGAEFIRKPDFICGKCSSVCTVSLG